MRKSTITQIGLFVMIIGLFSNFTYAQKKMIGANDIGNLSYSQVKNNETSTPCEEDYLKFLVYCVQDGSRIIYEFKNSKLDGIQMCTAHPTNYDAELELSEWIKEKKKSTGIEPLKINGQTLFNVESNPLGLSYRIEKFNNTYYTVVYIFLKD